MSTLLFKLGKWQLAIVLGVLLAAPSAQAQDRFSGKLNRSFRVNPNLGLSVTSKISANRRRMTGFKPNVHGFAFDNTFNNDVVSHLDIRTGGLCGGMVHSALDYYRDRRVNTPRQNYRPANRTPLQSYIYSRQVDSLIPNATKWAELIVNLGARNAEFFRWGLTSELANLKSYIDQGQPVPLGAVGVGDSRHQILAIGYETGAKPEDTKIFVYDPNHHAELIEMRPNMRGQFFYYVGKDRFNQPYDECWRTYFVDKSYRAKRPVRIKEPNFRTDGTVRALLATFSTGDDDLRGGNDNVNLVLHLHNGSKVTCNNINLGARWLEEYWENAYVALPYAVRKSDIRAVEINTTFRGGYNGDNWDAKTIRIEAVYTPKSRELLAQRRTFTRFTGDHRSVTLPVGTKGTPARAGQVTQLELKIKTGSDDLRGNEDNVHATVLFRDGSRQFVPVINARRRWGDQSEQTVWIRLNRPRDRAEVVGIELTTTFRGGFNGDNWNLDQIRVVPHTDHSNLPVYYERAGGPLKRFTGSDKRWTVRWS